MRRLLFVPFALILAAVPLTAQEATGPQLELGLVGAYGEASSLAELELRPSTRTLGLYANLYLTDRWVVSPSASAITWGSDGFTAGTFRTDVRYLFRGSGRVSPYVFGSGTAHIHGEATFDPDADAYALGAGVGVRVPLLSRLVVSLELRYDRWLDPGSDQLGLGLRVGIPLGGR